MEHMGKEVDLTIIGGGPAGTAAAVYAARKQLRTVLVTESFGGQSVVSPDIKNWIGTPSISGPDLAKSFEQHIREYEGEWLTIHKAKVTAIAQNGDDLAVSLDSGDSVITRTALVATGSTRRTLTVPGAAEFEHKGLTYCASCDGPLFAGKDLVVIGGGNAGFETAAQLLAYAKSVTLLHRNATYDKADAITVKKVLEHENMTAITSANITKVVGDTMVQGIAYEKDGTERNLSTEGVFVEIGLIPSTDFVKDVANLDAVGRITVDHQTQQSSHSQVWAAGDCSDGLFHQNNIAAGDAVKALEHIYVTLRAR